MPISWLVTFGLSKMIAMNNTSKDPNVKGRKYNGSPYLKLKRVKTSPRQKIRERLRSMIPLAELRPEKNTEQTT
jgi:hypothetical protein